LGGRHGLSGGFHQRLHVIGVALAGEVRIVAPPAQRDLGDARAQPPAFAIYNRNPYALRSVIDARNNRHSAHLVEFPPGRILPPVVERCFCERHFHGGRRWRGFGIPRRCVEGACPRFAAAMKTLY
jgi:hypothetical protein